MKNTHDFEKKYYFVSIFVFIHHVHELIFFLFTNSSELMSYLYSLKTNKKVARKFYYFHLKIHKNLKNRPFIPSFCIHNFKLQIFAILFWNFLIDFISLLKNSILSLGSRSSSYKTLATWESHVEFMRNQSYLLKIYPDNF